MAILYQWQVSTDEGTTFTDIPADTINVSGTKTAQIIFNNLTSKENNNQYRVRISNTDLNIPPVVSRPSILRTLPRITFNSQPSSQTTKTTTATFTSQVSTDYGEIKGYQWQRMGSSQTIFQDITDSTGIVGSKTANLSLTGLTTSNNNDKYRLAVTAQCCGTEAATVFSNTVTLLVVDPAQLLYFVYQPVNAAIDLSNNVLFNFSFNIDYLTPSDPTPTPLIQWQEIGTNGSVTNLNVTTSTTNNRLSTSATYSCSTTIPNTAVGKNYRVTVTHSGSSIVSTAVSVLTGVTPCNGCGGHGTGDPHYYLGIPLTKTQVPSARNFDIAGIMAGRVPAVNFFHASGFDDNKPVDGNRELLMLYIKDKNTNTEYLVTTKNVSTANNGTAPYNVGRTSVSKYQDGKLIDKPVNDATYDAMGVIKVTASRGRFKFVWSILEPKNIDKLKNLNIEMGGAWYWMLKSYFQYLKGSPAFSSLGWPWIGLISADAVGIGLAPFGLTRRDFEINDNRTEAGDPTDVSRLSMIISSKTVDDMTKNSSFWSDLSNAMQGKSLISQNTNTVFTTIPKDTTIINGSATFSADISANADILWEVSKDGGETWALVSNTPTKQLKVSTTNWSDNNSLYRAYFKNEQGAIIKSPPAKLTLPSTIVVGLIPVDTEAKNLSATFRAVATGVPPISYQWQKSDDQGLNYTDVAGGTSSQLELSNLKSEDDDDYYRIVIKDGAGNQYTSGPAILNINPDVLFTQQPVAATADNDENASFSVNATCSNGGLKYRWQVSEDQGKTFTNVTTLDSQNTTLNLSQLRFSDNGKRYRAQVITDIRALAFYSNTVTLSVPSSLTINAPPTNQVYTQDHAIFSVDASSSQPPITYQWQTSDPVIPPRFIDISGANQSAYIATGLMIQDNNRLYRVILSDQRQQYISPNVLVTVAGDFTINAWPTNQSSLSGQATFVVDATSSQPPIAYQWQTKIPDDNSDIFTNIIEATGSTYIANNLTLADDNRAYRVVLTDDVGSTVTSKPVYVDTTPQVSIIQQPSGYIPGNYILKLYTKAYTTNGQIAYSWQKCLPKHDAFMPISGQTYEELSLSVVPADSGSQYRARISVEGAPDLYTNTVKIDIPPSITVNSKLQKSAKINFPNKNIILSIDANSSVSPLSYQWQKSTPIKVSIDYSYTKNDIFYDYTQLMLNMEGDDGSKVVTDDSKNSFVPQLYVNNTLDTNGANIALSTNIKKIGNSSIRIGERASIRIPDPGGLLEFGNKDFTIECWCFPTQYSEMAIISRRLGDRHPNYANEGWSLSMNKFKAKIDDVWNSSWINDSLDNINLNEWTHIALTRKGSIYRLFRNGIMVSSFVNGGVLDETSGSINIGVGKSDNHENQFNGYLDNLKITIGLARYTKDFNPESNIDNNYDAYYNSNIFTNIPAATGSVLELSNLAYDNNYERYRVVLTDSVSSVIVEDQ